MPNLNSLEFPSIQYIVHVFIWLTNGLIDLCTNSPSQFHLSHGIDTLFFGQGAAGPCGSTVPGSTIAGQLAPKYGFYCLADADIPLEEVQNKSNILALFLADEPDANVSKLIKVQVSTA